MGQDVARMVENMNILVCGLCEGEKLGRHYTRSTQVRQSRLGPENVCGATDSNLLPLDLVLCKQALSVLFFNSSQ